jgi:hypothetical protein
VCVVKSRYDQVAHAAVCNKERDHTSLEKCEKWGRFFSEFLPPVLRPGSPMGSAADAPVASRTENKNNAVRIVLVLVYSLTYKLANAWQVGFNPTITYNHKADSGDKWNVPVGLFVGRTIKAGNTPLNIKAGLEHSVLSEDTFGKRTAFRIQITPVIQSLIKKPIFGK